MLWSLGRGLFPLLKLRLTIVVKSIYEFSHIAHNLLPLQKVFGTVPFLFFLADVQLQQHLLKMKIGKFIFLQFLWNGDKC